METHQFGPRTSHKDFFLKYVDLDRPEFHGIRNAAEQGDIALADRLFADAMKHCNPQKELLRNEWATGVAHLSEKERAKLLQHAEDAMDYKMNSCGIPWHFKDHHIDWEFNPTYNNYSEWPWQLSRHAEWNALARYYLLTGDEKAARTYADMLDSWLRQAVVPVDLPHNATWCWRTIEAGIRMMAWCFHISTFIDSPALSDRLITDYYISLYEHGYRLRTKCSHGNWLIMELHGLLKVALTGYFLKDSDEWYHFSVDRLCKELDAQVYPDGFQFELTTNYHRVVDGNYEGILRIFKILGLEAPAEMLERLEKLYNVYPHLTRPNRTLPDINDGAQVDIIPKMRIASSLYPTREDFRWFATDGKEGSSPDYLSYAFPYAGAVVMRSSWERDAIWAYMDCSPFGRFHQHEDKLNVLLDAYGKVLLTEAGVYDYDSSTMRRYVLSTEAHNTARLNGKAQRQAPVFHWEDSDLTKKATFEFTTTETRDTACATFNAGYGTYDWFDGELLGTDLEQMTHERRLIFIKDADRYGLLPFFAVIDRFSAQDTLERPYEIMWHMESCNLTENTLRVSGDFGDGIGLTVTASDTNATFVNMQGQYEPYYQGWFPIRPSGPHEHRPIPTPVLVGSFCGTKRIVTLLYPYRDKRGDDIVAVHASCNVNDHSFTVITKDNKEITLFEVT